MAETREIATYIRGNPAYHSEEGLRYADGELTVDNARPCPLCHKMPTPEGYDACLGYIPGARAACCGHGVKLGYVVMNGYNSPDTIKLVVEFERGDNIFWLDLRANMLMAIGWLLGFRDETE